MVTIRDKTWLFIYDNRKQLVLKVIEKDDLENGARVISFRGKDNTFHIDMAVNPKTWKKISDSELPEINAIWEFVEERNRVILEEEL